MTAPTLQMTDNDKEPSAGPPSVPARQSAERLLAATSHQKAQRLRPVQRAAIVMMSLGPDIAARLLTEFDESSLRRFAKAVNEMGTVPAGLVDDVVAEFVAALNDKKSLRGGPEEVRRFLGGILETERVDQIVHEVDQDNRSVWAQLAGLEDVRIASLLKIEHPQVAAYTLSRLSAMKAAQVLEHLEPTTARTIIVRMGADMTVDPDVTSRIGEVIGREFLSTGKQSKETRKPVDLVASVMNHVSSEIREDLLEHMDGDNPGLAKSVRRVMFTYANIPERMNPRDASLIVKAIDPQVLMRALKESGPVTAFILDNLSKRMVERLREDIAELPDVSRKEIEMAKTEITATIQEMVQNGTIQFLEMNQPED